VRRAFRILAYSLATLLVIFIALCAAGEIRQRLLVHRAQRLLEDIHALRLHQSTWADAEKLMTRWGRWGHYEGRCTHTDCMYVVTLDNGTVPYGNNVAEWPSRTTVLMNMFRLLPRQWGGGLRQLQGMFLVQDGLVVRSGLAIDMTASPWAKGAQDTCCGDELIISVLSRSSIDENPQSEDDMEHHPDYKVWRPGGCTFCLMGRVTYAASVSPEVAAQLTDFQLSCATRWSSCLTLEQLDPAARAWHLYGPPWGEAPQEENEFSESSSRCHMPIYARARDAQVIRLVEAMNDSREQGSPEGEPRIDTTPITVIDAAKGAMPPIPGAAEIVTRGRGLGGGKRGEPVVLLRGKRYYLFTDAPDPNIPKSMWPYYYPPNIFDLCGVEMWTPESEAEIQRGAALNDALRGYEPTVSLRGFARHERGPFDQ
jgi:hypothetical protein